MSHIALYREWRPQTFSDVVAQNQVTYPLKQSIINGSIGHAYLFSGTRGTGKTSTAKIFAKAVNCLDPKNGDPCNQCEICEVINDGSLLDVMEIDAASNNSVDNIRRITEEVVFMPTRAKYKVYIIDEVHMLSAGAFNALLKTLEEPPSHVIFILATTEPHRIPATVLSRCLRFDFRRISQKEIVGNLVKIATNEEIEIEDSALNVIAQLSDGAMRDAISLLDQAKSGITPPITNEKLFDMIGIVQDQFLLKVTVAICNNDLKEILNLVEQMVMSGKDLERFITEFAQFLRNLLITQITKNMDDWFGFSESQLNLIKQLSKDISSDTLLNWIEELSKLSNNLRFVSDVRVAIEISFIKLMKVVEPKTNSITLDKDENTGKIDNKEVNSSDVSTTKVDNEDLEKVRVAKKIEDDSGKKVITEIDAEQKIKSSKKEESIEEEEHSSSTPAKKQPVVISNDKSKSMDNKSQKEIWQATLDGLVKKNRIDLKMLLSPAIIEAKDQDWKIIFSDDLKA
ncbi:MAG: DNA polymerase III subunit gamma/tau, partial [Clostridiaceae bacterium]|nr:DNA polymerase III subunit gamma/tau [Clostridiaceae bacterium]